MKYLLGVDFGGGGSKATLLGENGTVKATASGEYSMSYPKNGWVEQNANEIYGVFVENVQAILGSSGVSAQDIAALSLDGGTHIAVLLDKNGREIRPSIYWSDTRSASQAASLVSHSARILKKTYNLPSSMWTLPQLMWLRKTEPENFARIDRIMFLKDYIRWRLTAETATDSIEAMGAMLLDADEEKWDTWLCSLCGIDPAMLPPIVHPLDIVGYPTASACAETGLWRGTKVCAGATDTVMEIYAAGAIKPGQSTLKLATAGRICVVTPKAVSSPLLVCYRHIIPGLWYPGTATKTCASALRWYRDSLCAEEKRIEREGAGNAYKLIDARAEGVPAGSDGLLFHPYLLGEIAPYPNASLRASFTNVSALHTKAHFDRALMEGVAYSMRDCLCFINDLEIETKGAVRMIGGGSKSPLWRQITADVLNIPLCHSLTGDSSMGSAMLAGVASGVFESFEQSVELCSQTGDIVYPNPCNRTAYDHGFEVYRAVHDALAPVYDRINA